jgi:hypothetical protein
VTFARAEGHRRHGGAQVDQPPSTSGNERHAQALGDRSSTCLFLTFVCGITLHSAILMPHQAFALCSCIGKFGSRSELGGKQEGGIQFGKCGDSQVDTRIESPNIPDTIQSSTNAPPLSPRSARSDIPTECGG